MKTKINSSSTQTISRKLSIQFSLDGFSFCIQNQAQIVTDFANFPFNEKLNNPADLLSEIEAIFSSEKLLQQDFDSVLAIHQNDLATFVPSDFFIEENLSSYLKHTVKVLKTDFIAFDGIDIIKAKNVYIPYVNINNFLFQHFGEFTYKHHLSVLVEKLLHLDTSEKKCYVHVCETSFDIVVTENKKLLFSNSFKYQSKEDFIYYLLFVLEQLKLNTETFLVTFLGKVLKNDAIYKIAYKYVRNIDFLENDTSFFNSKTTILPHQNYLLIN